MLRPQSRSSSSPSSVEATTKALLDIEASFTSKKPEAHISTSKAMSSPTHDMQHANRGLKLEGGHNKIGRHVLDRKNSSGGSTSLPSHPNSSPTTAPTQSQYKSFTELSIESSINASSMRDLSSSSLSNTPSHKPGPQTITDGKRQRLQHTDVGVLPSSKTLSKTSSKTSIISGTTNTVNNTHDSVQQHSTQSPPSNIISRSSSMATSSSGGTGMRGGGSDDVSSSIMSSAFSSAGPSQANSKDNRQSLIARTSSSANISASATRTIPEAARIAIGTTTTNSRFDTRAAAVASEFGGSLLARTRRVSDLDLMQNRQDLKRDLMLNDPKSPYLKELLREDGELAAPSSSSSSDGVESARGKDDVEGRRSVSPLYQSKTSIISISNPAVAVAVPRINGLTSTTRIKSASERGKTGGGDTSLSEGNASLTKRPPSPPATSMNTIPSRPLSQRIPTPYARTSTPSPETSNQLSKSRASPMSSGAHGRSSVLQTNSSSSATGTGGEGSQHHHHHDLDQVQPCEQCLAVWRSCYEPTEEMGSERLRALEMELDQQIRTVQMQSQQLAWLEQKILQSAVDKGVIAKAAEEEKEEEDEEQQKTMVDDGSVAAAAGNQQRIEELERALAELEAKLQESNSERDDAKLKFQQQLTAAADEFYKDKAMLVKCADEAETALKQTQRQLEDEREQVRLKVKDRGVVVKELQGQVEKKQHQLETLRSQLSAKDDQLTGQQTKLEQSIKSLVKLTETHSKLGAENVRLSTLVSDHQRQDVVQKNQLRESETRIEQLEYELQEIQKQAQETVADLERELQHVEATNDQLSSAVGKLEQQLDEEKRATVSLKQELARRNQQDEQRLSARNKTQQQQQSFLTERNNALEKQVVEMGSMLESVRRWLADLQDEFRDDDANNDQETLAATAPVRGKANHHTAAGSSSAMNMSAMTEELEVLHQRIRQFKQCRDEEVLKLKRQLSDKEQEQVDLEQLLSETNNQLKAAERKLEETRQQQQQSRKHQETLEQHQQHQQRQHEQRARELEVEVAGLEKESKRLELEILHKDEELAELDRKLHDALDRLRRQDDRTASLEADLVKTKAEWSAQVRQERNRTNAVEKELEVTKVTLATTESALSELRSLAKKEQHQRKRHHRRSFDADTDIDSSHSRSSSLSRSYVCSQCEHSMLSSPGHSVDGYDQQSLEKTVAQQRSQIAMLEKQVSILGNEMDRLLEEKSSLQQDLDASYENIQILSDKISDQAKGARAMSAKKTERIKILEEEQVRLRQLVLIQEGNLYASLGKVETLKMERAKLKMELHRLLLAVAEKDNQDPGIQVQQHPENKEKGKLPVKEMQPQEKKQQQHQQGKVVRKES